MSGKAKRYRIFSPGPLAAGALLLITVLMVLGHRFYFRDRLGPEQPIPFSHRIHAGEKQIGCLFCHDGAAETARAGVPPLETCMLCHSRIIVTYPPIRNLREHFFERRPVLWKRIYDLPDFVYFDHSVHLHRSVDCSRCHGDVAAMDRVEPPQEINMGFCISCHRRYDATHDCFACHR